MTAVATDWSDLQSAVKWATLPVDDLALQPAETSISGRATNTAGAFSRHPFHICSLRRGRHKDCGGPTFGSVADQEDMTEEYRLFAETPCVEDYLRLRIAAGLSPKSAEAAASGLPNTLFAIVVRARGEAIGMGRVIGDGGLFFQIVDIAVLPEHQGRGLGTAIVGALVDHLRATAHKSAYVSLIADGEAHRLYARFGFAHTAPKSVGMAFVV